MSSSLADLVLPTPEQIMQYYVKVHAGTVTLAVDRKNLDKISFFPIDQNLQGPVNYSLS